MLFEKNSFGKKNMGKYILGYELGREHVQISYLKIGEKEPETLSAIIGQEQYNIPFSLYKSGDSKYFEPSTAFHSASIPLSASLPCGKKFPATR